MNFDLIHPSGSVSDVFSGMLDIAVNSGAWSSVMVKLALKAGSSKQGKTLRPVVSANIVEPTHLWDK